MSTFTLEAAQTIQGVAGTAAAVSYFIDGIEKDTATGANTFKMLAAQALLPSSTGVLGTVGAGKAWLPIVHLSNTTGSAVTGCKLFVGGSAAANQITGTFSIPANGTAIAAGDSLSVYDSAGSLITASALALNSVDNTFLADMVQATVKGRASGAGTGDPQDLTGTQLAVIMDAATNALKGSITAAQFLELAGVIGAKGDGTRPTIFRPIDYAVSAVYDPTGASTSTSFASMMTAFIAFNDRALIEFQPGVFKVDPAVIAIVGTAPEAIRGPGRGICVLIPTSGGDFIKLGAGSDGNNISGFAIYNTSGTPFTTGAGINTNDADSVLIEDMLFVDLFHDVRVGGRQVASTTNGTTTVSGISPVLTAGDVGKAFNGVGIPTGTTISSQTGSSCVLNNAATISTSATRYVGNTIKCSIQKTLHSQTNGNASSVGVYVENGDAGDTYIGPDVVMSNNGATRRRASVELVATGHYEITQANLTGSVQGTLADPGASQTVAFGFHTNVLNDSCTVNGMTLAATLASATIKNIKSVNSWYSGTTTGAGLSGVVTSGAGVINGVTHSCDRFLNNQRHGYEHAVGTDFRWSDCDMKGNNAVNAAIGTGYDGLNVAAGVSNWSVNGGKYGGTDTLVASPNQRYGIFVAIGAGNSIKIAPDDLSGNRDGPILCGATGASVNISWCPGLAASGVLTARVTNAGAEAVVKNITVPKNSQRIGTTYLVTGGGLYTNTTTAVTATVRIRFGTTTLTGNIPAGITCAGGTIARTSMPFSILGLITVQTIGAGGTVDGWITMTLGNATQVLAGIPLFAAVTLAAVALDTTADKLLELTCQSAGATTSLVWTAAQLTPSNY